MCLDLYNRFLGIFLTNISSFSLEQIVTTQANIPDQATYVMKVKVYDDCLLTQTGTVTLTVPNTVTVFLNNIFRYIHSSLFIFLIVLSFRNIFFENPCIYRCLETLRNMFVCVYLFY